MGPLSPDVSAYMDFRTFLKDCYEDRKRQNPKFSHRYFCKKAGYGSSSAFADILAGRRSLSSTAALRLSRALELNKDEEEYLLHLVSFNQAGSLELKNLHYAKLLAMSKIQLNVISADKYEYFSQWYHAALRELLYFTDFKEDYKSLGRKLNPSVPTAQVKKAIGLLEKLGMIAKDAQGYYRQTANLISSDDLGESLHVENFQTATMKLAMESLDRHAKDARDISTLTATLSAESVEKVRAALKTLRKCVLTLAEQDKNVDRVIQLNIQMFPLTQF